MLTIQGLEVGVKDLVTVCSKESFCHDSSSCVKNSMQNMTLFSFS